MVSRIAELEAMVAELTKQLSEMSAAKNEAEVAMKKLMTPKSEDKTVSVKASVNHDSSTANVLELFKRKQGKR